jgi:pyruvate kinase
VGVWQVGSEVLIDDGLISMTVLSKTAHSVTCRVANNGILGQVPLSTAFIRRRLGA